MKYFFPTLIKFIGVFNSFASSSMFLFLKGGIASTFEKATLQVQYLERQFTIKSRN